jgi:hypothetical protein
MNARRILSILPAILLASPVLALPAVQSGLVGLARGQTARLTVINLTPADPELPPDPCVAFLAFADQNGRSFVDANGSPLRLEAQLEFGDSATLALPSGLAFSGIRGLRRPIQAAVTLDPAVPPKPCLGLASSLEIYDSLTGLSAVSMNLGAPSTEYNPGPPEELVGLLGLARFENAQLSVINLAAADAPACDLILAFVDASGEPFVDTNGERLAREASLLAGEQMSLELRWPVAFGASTGLRSAFRAVVEINPGPPELPLSPCDSVVPTLEVYGVLTGRTHVQINPGPPEVRQTSRGE